jgi:hypothetical protein
MKLNITKGPRKAPVRAVIYGVEGVGKTSLAAQLPAPLFLDMEEGTAQLDVARAQIDTADELRNALSALAADPQGFRSIIIDSADWAERIACEALLKKSGKKSIEDFGFGKGFVMLAEVMSRLLTACDTLVHRGLHVVWIAHAKTSRVSPPDMVDGFDRYELKMAKQTAPLFKEWADLLLFANFETVIVKGNDGRVKGEGGKRRLLYTERAAAWDAKNRYGLPETLPLEHGTIAPELAAVFAGKVAPRISPPAPVETAPDNAGSAPEQAAPQPGGESIATKPATATEKTNAERANPIPKTPTPPPATAEQIATLTTYDANSVAGPVIERALEHYRALDASELTEEQAAKVIARCQEEMNKPAEKPAAPKPTGPAFPWARHPEIVAWLEANAAAVETYAASKKWIAAGQTWRDIGAENCERIVERLDAFKSAVAKLAGGAK